MFANGKSIIDLEFPNNLSLNEWKLEKGHFQTRFLNFYADDFHIFVRFVYLAFFPPLPPRAAFPPLFPFPPLPEPPNPLPPPAKPPP